MCGEHEVVQTAERAAAGSSPHVRGALVSRVEVSDDAGIIPACAGSTSEQSPLPNDSGDHPRMCGEHTIAEVSLSSRGGSSPHVRGALLLASDRQRLRGIIPACAGSTGKASSTQDSTRDHPRMCGEHDWITTQLVSHMGSSPHVRGAPTIFSFSFALYGIIPACAGSTTGLRHN